MGTTTFTEGIQLETDYTTVADYEAAFSTILNLEGDIT